MSTTLRGLLAASLLLATPALAAQPKVEFVTPESAEVVQKLSLTGSVTAAMDAALSPQIAGLVDTVLVDAGAVVEPGQTLLQLDSTLAKLALKVDEAALREAHTRLTEAQRLRDEAEPLARQGSLPQSEFSTRRAQAELAAAGLARLQAQHAQQAERVARHSLTAPFAGVIRARLTAPGEWVETGVPVLELVATSNLRIDVQVPQKYIGDLAGASKAWVEIDAFPGREFAAPVVAQVPAVNAGARSFLVRVALNDMDVSIAPGMSARVQFQLPGAKQAVAVPRDALLRFPDGSSMVWVIDDNDTAQRRPVTLGTQRGESVVITQGLKRNERVVVRGNEALKQGDVVKPQLHQPS